MSTIVDLRGDQVCRGYYVHSGVIILSLSNAKSFFFKFWWKKIYWPRRLWPSAGRLHRRRRLFRHLRCLQIKRFKRKKYLKVNWTKYNGSRFNRRFGCSMDVPCSTVWYCKYSFSLISLFKCKFCVFHRPSI